MSESETVWHVQVEDGVKVWSLDQLDAAFKAGIIDEATYVFEDGGSEWLKLGALLGSDEEPEPRPSPVPQSLAPQSLAPQSFAPQSFTPPSSFAPRSTAPIVTDLDDLDAPVAFRSKKRGMVIGMSLLLVAAGVAIAGFRFGTTATEAAPVAAAAPAPPPAPVVATPTPDVKPADAGVAEAARLSDDQKRALLDADKTRETKLAEKQKARAAASPRHRKSAHEKTPFQNGGNKYDPLNAKL